MNDPGIVREYVDDVLAGRRVVGKLERLAVERYLRDLEDAHERGFVFDERRALRVFRFFDNLRHYSGEWANRPIELSPFQAFVIWNVYGWVDEATGYRRFRHVYEETARKSGKTTKLGGVGLYGLVADSEPAAEIYSAATKKDQARIMHTAAIAMRASSPMLRRAVVRSRDNLRVTETLSKYEPLSSDSSTLDGLSPSTVLLDELHAHRDRHLHDVLVTGCGARRQPLVWRITTAGDDLETICYSQREHSVDVLEGRLADDRWFAYVATLDVEDDWEDVSTWAKANPNLGISPKLEFLTDQLPTARRDPAYRLKFLRYHLNRWTQADAAWIPPELWERNANPFELEELVGAECYAGLDLSMTTDLTAVALVFPTFDPVRVLWFHWIPEDRALDRERQDRVPFRAWAREGYLELTPGNVVDYSVVRQRINELGDRYSVQEIAYDRYNATQLALELQSDGFRMVEFPQGIKHFTGPTKRFRELLELGRLAHNGNPLVRWQAGNVAVRENQNEDIQPVKVKDRKRIDGIVAAIMALGRAVAHVPSVYDRGEGIYST